MGYGAAAILASTAYCLCHLPLCLYHFITSNLSNIISTCLQFLTFSAAEDGAPFVERGDVRCLEIGSLETVDLSARLGAHYPVTRTA